MADLTQPLQLSSVTQPTAPVVRAAPRPAVILSPGERDYLRLQARHILMNGGSERDIVNFTQTHIGLPRQARAQAVTNIPTEFEDTDEPATEDNLISGLSLNALQGITFGFGDEAVGSLLGVLTGEGAAGGREEYRERLRRWNENNRKKAFGAEILGGLLTGGLLARGLALGAGKVGARTLGARLGVAAAEGALAGGVAGAGHAEGTISERSKTALGGAVMGAVLGPAAIGAGRAVGAVARPVGRGARNLAATSITRLNERIPGLHIPGLGSSAEAHATHFLLDSFEQEGLDIERLRSAAHALRANGAAPTLADVGGEGTLTLLSETLGSRTPAKQKLAEALLTRQTEQGERLSGSLFRRIMRSTNLGLRNAYDAVDDLREMRASAAQPLYADAFQHTVPTSSRMQALLQHPKLRAAYEEGRRIAQTEELAGVGHGLEIPDLPAGGLGVAARESLIDMGVTGDALERMLAQLPNDFPPALPVRALDYMKRGLDVIIRRGLKSDKALEAGEVRALRSMLDEVLGAADSAVPAYGQARAVWGGTTQAMDAVELGQQFLRKAPPIVAREMADLMEKSPGLADFYRLGATQSLYEAATGSAARNEVTDIAGRFFGGRIYGARSQDADRIRALFPDAPEVAQDFMRQVAAEARISHTAKAIGSGRGGRRLQEFEEAVEGTPIQARMSPTLTIYSAIRDSLVKGQKRFREEVSDEVAKMFSRGIDNPLELDLLLDKLAYAETRRLMLRRWGAQARLGTIAGVGLLSGKLAGSAQ